MKKPSVLVAAGVLVLTLSGCSALVSPDTHSTAVPAGTTAPTPSKAEAVAPKELNSSQLLGGNARPSFPAGEAGKVSVVAQGQLSRTEGMESGILLIAYRNNTSKAVAHVDFTVAAKVDGKVVASGNSQTGSIPAQLQPGEVALDYIYFSNVSSVPDAGVTYEFQAQTMPADTSSYNTAALKVTQADNNGSAIIGSASNPTDKTLQNPFGVYAYCFEGDTLSSYVDGFAKPDAVLSPGGEVTFSIDLYGRKCDSFVLGVSGYFS
ncbi:hypothetical protein [Microbacterium xylanilyticum]